MPTPTVLLNNGSMVHNQTITNENEMVMTISRADPLRFCSRMVPWFIIKQTQTEMVMTISHTDPLLENGSMIHNEMNAGIWKPSTTFLENVRVS